MDIKNDQTQTIFFIAPYIFCSTIPTFFTKTTNASSSAPHFIPFYTRVSKKIISYFAENKSCRLEVLSGCFMIV